MSGSNNYSEKFWALNCIHSLVCVFVCEYIFRCKHTDDPLRFRENKCL